MNTETLTQTIKERFDHAATKQILKEKYEAKLIFAEAGGMWKASPELITTLSLFDTDTIVLEDVYDNPVQVDRLQLLNNSKERWQEQMNGWLFDHQQSAKQR